MGMEWEKKNFLCKTIPIIFVYTLALRRWSVTPYPLSVSYSCDYAPKNIVLNGGGGGFRVKKNSNHMIKANINS
jgi:hypothetical protein